MSYTLYILECVNKSYYIGYTTDLQRRYQEHCEGSSKCKYTRSFPPKKIAASWVLNHPLSTILKIEHAMKKLPKKNKTRLIEDPSLFDQWFLESSKQKN